MQIDILCISDSDKHFVQAISEYVKRLGKSVHIHNCKPYKHDNRAVVIEKETQYIQDLLDKKFVQHYKILLSKSGKNITTEQLVTLCHKYTHIVFIIGGPYGLDEDILINNVDILLSFGSMTMPHGLAKLVLLEQLYRVQTIQGGKQYHY